jgi:hypothetical protein
MSGISPSISITTLNVNDLCTEIKRQRLSGKKPRTNYNYILPTENSIYKDIEGRKEDVSCKHQTRP